MTRDDPHASRPAPRPARTLAHPTRLLVTSGSTVFVADTGHHRVLQLEIDDRARSARIERIFGDSTPGFEDGPAEQARFHSPRGLARQGSSLYVADTDNHAIRAVDLQSGAVRTVAGTGVEAAGAWDPNAAPREQALSSPCALWIDRPRVLIAMRGGRQIVALEDERALYPFAGDGRAALLDGPALQASFNQPVDLCGNGQDLFVADPEANAIRRVRLVGKPAVETIVGQGTLEVGDRDGIGATVRLQHPAGIAFDGLIFIADSDNHRIKQMDPETRQVARLAGSAEAGFVDGGFTRARFSRPEGLAVRGKHLFVADTDNHAVRVCDLLARNVWTLAIAD